MGSTQQNMKTCHVLLAVTATLCLLAAADATCTTDMAKPAYATCVTTQATAVTAAGADKTKMCAALKGTIGCYPKACCTDATYKAVVDASIASAKTSFDCTITCGAASGATALHSSMFATLAILAISLVTSY